MPSIERLWPGSTIAIVASGPSLVQSDVDQLRGRCRVIAINRSWELCPWADVLYAADFRFWNWHKGVPDFKGLKVSVSKKSAQWPDVTVLAQGHETLISDDPTTLALGKNSGAQCLNLALHLGAARIVLLGYDMSRGPKGEHHWHREHPVKTQDNYDFYARMIAKMAPQIASRGVSVVNCSSRTALKCFPCVSLDQALASREVAA